MPEASAVATRPNTGDCVTDAGWTDCDLDPSIGFDSEALVRLGITRAVFGRLPRTTVTLSPEPAPHGLAARFVIPAPAHPDPAMLRDLHAQGVRGVRFVVADNADRARAQLDKILRYADRIADSDWHIELTLGANADPGLLAAAEWTLMRLPVAICLSGVAPVASPANPDNPDIAFALALLRIGRTWIKLTGVVASSGNDERTPLQTFVSAVVATRPDRIVWGSGPRTAADGNDFSRISAALATLTQWIPDKHNLEAVLAENPSQLYGFPGCGVP